MNHEALRRAAILISSLDTESADALLDEMSPEQAMLIRNAAMDLGHVDVVEQQEIIQQFVGNRSRRDTYSNPGTEFIPELARKLDRDPDAKAHSNFGNHASEEHSGPADHRPFAFLDSVESSELARVLLGEHPQVVAIVVAYLPPDRAADVLEQMPREHQTDALMRIARLNVPAPEVIQDLEQEMQGLLANRGLCESVDADGLATVTAILNNANGTARDDLVSDLSQQDKTLARQLRVPPSPRKPRPAENTRAGQTDSPLPENEHPAPPPPDVSAPPDQPGPENPRRAGETSLTFADLEQWDGPVLAQILKRCPADTTLLALVGASRKFVERISGELPKKEAAQLERKLQKTGPLRLDDIQRAQQQMIDVAQQLIDEGDLKLPEKKRLSVAA